MVNATRNKRDRLKAAQADERRRLKTKITALKEANQKLEKKLRDLARGFPRTTIGRNHKESDEV